MDFNKEILLYFIISMSQTKKTQNFNYKSIQFNVFFSFINNKRKGIIFNHVLFSFFTKHLNDYNFLWNWKLHAYNWVYWEIMTLNLDIYGTALNPNTICCVLLLDRNQKANWMQPKNPIKGINLVSYKELHSYISLWRFIINAVYPKINCCKAPSHKHRQ